MYAALWRALPGPTWLRVILALLIVTAVLAACLFFVFPWINSFVSVTDVTVER
ncbi:MAG: hypothetical protein JWL94_1019 [Microbacteriaceae bacterium]|nr:hypothetical protein [Microbacteriaceae bacterium]HEV7957613.1 hypothetical protein [Marisediminicola sp.]